MSVRHPIWGVILSIMPLISDRYLTFVTGYSCPNWSNTMKTRPAKFALMGLVLFLPACTSSFEPKVESVGLEGEAVISSLPSLSHTMVMKAGSTLHSCLGRGSDATFSQSDTGDVSISLVSTGSSSGADNAGNSENSGETEMAGRTPAVLMAREMFYRTCEFSNNYQLPKDEALKLYLQTMSAVSAGWKAEVGKTTITIGETISVSDTNSASDTNDGDTGVFGNTSAADQ